MLRLLSCQNIALAVIHLGDRKSNQLVRHGKCRVESFDRSVALFRVDKGQQIHHWVIARQRIAYHLIVRGNQQRAAVNKTFLGSTFCFATLFATARCLEKKMESPMYVGMTAWISWIKVIKAFLRN